MTSVNVTTTKNTVTVNGETRVVTVKTQGPQGPAFADGDIGDIVISGGGTVATIDNGAVNNAKIASNAAIDLTKLATGALPTAITVTSANISDLSIVDADISGSAAISLSKLATGALPTAITVTSANISDLSIVNADINASAAIAGTKISPDFGSQNIVTTGTGATGALGVTGDITVSGTVDGRDVAADGTKLDGIESGATADQTASEILTLIKTVDGAGSGLDADTLDGISSASFVRSDADDTMTGNLTISNTAPRLDFIDSNNNSDFRITNSNGLFVAYDITNGATRFSISSDGTTTVAQNLDVGAGLDVTGNITVTGTVDGRDVATDGTKLDGIETGATADQTAAEIKTLLDSNGIVNSNVDASAAIAGTKISPDFGSQNIVTTGTLGSGDVTISSVSPTIDFVDSNDNPDYRIRAESGIFKVRDITNNADRFVVNTDGHIDIGGNLDVGAGVDVTGNITVTGTVDGVDIATRDTLFGGLTSSSGVLSNGVTATTQSASDNSTKVATTAYTDTAIANLVDSAPGTLNTLNELAAALGDDANFSTTVTNSIATKMPLAGGTFSGNLITRFIVPDNDSQRDLGTTSVRWRAAYVDNYYGSGANLTNLPSQTDQNFTNADHSKLDGIEANATADQTASEIVALVADQTIAPSEIDMEDNEKIKLGTGDDLEIYHSGSHSYIENSTNFLFIHSNSLALRSFSQETFVDCSLNGSVELYYDNSKKFHTRSNGVEITGNTFIRADSSTDGILLIYADNGDDHDDLWRLKATDSGSNFHIDNYASSSWETTIKAVGNAQTELYYDNSKKLETSSDGVIFTGAARFVGNETGFLTGKAQPTIYRTASTSGSYPFNEFGHLVIQSRNDGSNRDIIFATGTSSAKLNRITSDGHLDVFGDNQKLRIGAGQDLELFHDGTDSFLLNATGEFQIANSGSGNTIFLQAKAGENSVRALANGATELYYDSSKKFETTSYGVLSTEAVKINGDFIEVNNSADSQYTLNKGGTQLFSIRNNSTSGVHINTQNSALLCLGVSTGTNNGTVESTLSINSSGNVGIDNQSASEKLHLADNKKLAFGNGADLKIYHDGSNSYINDSGTGALRYLSNTHYFANAALSEIQAQFIQNGAVELYYDNSKKLETTSTGITVTGTINSTSGIIVGGSAIFGDNEKIKLGNSNDLQIYHDGSHSYVADSGTGNLYIQSNHLNIDTDHGEQMVNCYKNGQVELFYDNSKKFETTSSGVTVTGGVTTSALSVGDNQEIKLGDGNDLKLFHNGNHSYIADLGTGDLRITGSAIHLQNAAQSENMLRSFENGAVELYYDNSKKLETTSTGVSFNDTNITNVGSIALDQIKGDADDNTNITFGGSDVITFKCGDTSPALTVNTTQVKVEDSQKFVVGTGNDLQIYHDGSNSYIDDTGTGNLNIRSNQINFDKYTGEALARFRADGNCELFHNNVSKFETTSTGVSVTGGLTTTANIDAGTANFLTDDNGKFISGTAGDLQIYHGGTNSIIQNSTGDLYFKNTNNLFIQVNDTEAAIYARPNAAVELYYDNSKKLETTSTGVSVTGNIAVSGTVDGVDVAALSASVSGFLSNIVEDTSPQLGGELQTNGNDISFADNDRATFGDGDDFRIFHNGSDNFISGTGNIYLKSSGFLDIRSDGNETMIKATPNGAVELYHDGSLKANTRSDGFEIKQHLTMGDSDEIRLGNSSDLKIYHDGSNSYIQDLGTGQLRFLSNDYVFYNAGGNENIARFIENGAVELYFNGSKKAFTYADGLHIDTGVLRGDDNALIKLGNDGDLQIYHDSSTNDGFIKELGTGRLQIWTSSLHLKNQAGDEINLVTNENGNCELWFDNSKKFETTSTGATVTGTLAATNTNITTQMFMPDNGQIRLGDSDDLQIYHDGSNSYIQNSTGGLFIKNTDGSNLDVFSHGSARIRVNAGEMAVDCSHNSSVDLYFDNSKKLGTASDGITVYGRIAADELDMGDSEKIKLGTGDDLQIYHDGSHSYIKNTTGHLRIGDANVVIMNAACDENMIHAVQNDRVELYYDNSVKFETTSTGINIPASVPTITLSDTDGNTPYSRITAGGGDLVFEADQGDEEANTLMLFRVDDSEAMRIESSGAIRFGATAAIQQEKYTFFRQESDANTLAYFHQGASADVSGIWMRHGRALSGFSGKMISFRRNDGNEVGSITLGASSTSFNTSSDYRLKENVTSITDGITRLKTLKPYRFNFKDDTTKPVVDGFFAHEVTAVPEAITGTKDEVDADNNPVYQSIDHSKLVPLLVAAVQELIGRVEKLEGA